MILHHRQVRLNPWPFLISFCFIFYLATDIADAAGMIARVQQMKAQKQKQAQEAQQQEYQQYQQQQPGQSQSSQAPAPPTYQQTIDQRNQAIAQAIMNAHNQSISTGNQETGSTQAVSSVGQQTSGQVQQQATDLGVIDQVPVNYPEAQPQPSAVASSTNDTVDISEVWKKLDKKSTVWMILADDQAKMLTVSEYIDRFHKEGVKINEPPSHYVQMVDQIFQANPGMLQRPFGEVIQIAAIVDYDFDNGMNKDDLAKKVLGEQGFEANKKRFAHQ